MGTDERPALLLVTSLASRSEGDLLLLQVVLKRQESGGA